MSLVVCVCRWLASYPFRFSFFFTFHFHFHFQRFAGQYRTGSVMRLEDSCSLPTFRRSSCPFLLSVIVIVLLSLRPVMAYVHGRDKNVLHACICIIVSVINGNGDGEKTFRLKFKTLHTLFPSPKVKVHSLAPLVFDGALPRTVPSSVEHYELTKACKPV